MEYYHKAKKVHWQIKVLEKPILNSPIWTCLSPIPKKHSTRFIIAIKEKSTTSPTRALVILLRADSYRILSPPEEIHSIPPIISIKIKITPPITSPKDIKAGINLPKNCVALRLPRLPSAGLFIV